MPREVRRIGKAAFQRDRHDRFVGFHKQLVAPLEADVEIVTMKALPEMTQRQPLELPNRQPCGLRDRGEVKHIGGA